MDRPFVFFREPERERVLPLLEAVPRLDFLASDWELAGDIGAELRRQGRTLPVFTRAPGDQPVFRWRRRKAQAPTAK